MPGIFNIVLFLLFKATQVFLGWYCFQYFDIEFNIIVVIFYGGLSLLQMVFYIFQNVHRKIPADKRSIFRHVSILIFLMEMVIIATALYFLYVYEYPEVELITFLFIGVVGMGVNSLFYALHQSSLSWVISKTKLEYSKISSFSIMIYLFLSFIIPVGYTFFKLIILEQELQFYDLYMIGGYWGVMFLSLILLFSQRSIRARKTIRQLETVRPDLEKFNVLVNDSNEIGAIQSAILNLEKKFIEHKDHVLLYNNYLSNSLREEISQYGLDLNGEEKNASVLTILYSLHNGITSPSKMINIISEITRIAGEYSEQYDAYPFFCYGKLVLVFGVPYYYEHQKYHAIECAISILDDLQELQNEQNFEMEVHAGAFTGRVVCGAISSYGKNYQQLTVAGQVMEDSAKIAAIAKRLGKNLLIDPITLDQLQSKFYVEKSYKTKWNGKEEIILHQLRI